MNVRTVNTCIYLNLNSINIILVLQKIYMNIHICIESVTHACMHAFEIPHMNQSPVLIPLRLVPMTILSMVIVGGLTVHQCFILFYIDT